MDQNKAITPEQLLALLEAVISEAPEFVYQQPLTDKDIRWLARANALIEKTGDMSAIVNYRAARAALGSYSHDREKLLIPLHDAYCLTELLAPVASQGAFIPAGETWNGYAAIVKLIQNECDELLVVDPYLNSAIYSEFAPHSKAKKGIRFLTSKSTENHLGLQASALKWASDPIAQNLSVEVRYAPPKTLHDRLIIIDGMEVWLITQSFKDIAKRSPASVSRANNEVGMLKAQHYETLWTQSVLLS